MGQGGGDINSAFELGTFQTETDMPQNLHFSEDLNTGGENWFQHTSNSPCMPDMYGNCVLHTTTSINLENPSCVLVYCVNQEDPRPADVVACHSGAPTVGGCCTDPGSSAFDLDVETRCEGEYDFVRVYHMLVPGDAECAIEVPTEVSRE